MKASNAIDGQLYSIPARGKRLAYGTAECLGFNHSNEWVLFTVNDDWGRRKAVMVMPDEEITPARTSMY